MSNMVDVIEIARALANAPIPAEEKKAWKEAIPYMPEEEVNKLLKALQEHSEEVERLRTEYLEKAQKIIDQEKASEVAEGLNA